MRTLPIAAGTGALGLVTCLSAGLLAGGRPGTLLWKALASAALCAVLSAAAAAALRGGGSKPGVEPKAPQG